MRRRRLLKFVSPPSASRLREHPSAPPRAPWVGWAVLALGLLTLGSLLGAIVSPGATTQLEPGNCTYEPVTASWLSSQEQKWSQHAPVPLVSGAVLMAASYGNPESPGSSLNAILADLAMLKESGAQVIRIDLNFQPWLEQNATLIAELDAVVAQIRSDGLALMIADSASETYWHHPLSWSDFVTAAVQRETTLAKLYHPDYYVLVKEPGWYYPMVQGYPWNPSVESVTNWVDLTQQLISVVREASPQTVVGVAVAASSLYTGGASTELSYLEAARSMPGLDFLGFDIYGVCDFENTLTFLAKEGTGGKQVWVPEAWSSAGSSVFEPSMVSLDVPWVQTLYAFLSYIGARGVGMFYTDLFAQSAPPPGNSSALLQYYSGRTPVFYAFQNATKGNRMFGFALGLSSVPGGCGDPHVTLATGGPALVNTAPAGSYSIVATPCPGYRFQAWSYEGDISVTATTDPNSSLIVLGPGNVTAVYSQTSFVGLGVVILPVSCSGTAVTIGSSKALGGGSFALTSGDFSLVPEGCPGMTLGSLEATGNLTVSGEQLSVRGPGTLLLVYVPASPPATLFGLPINFGYLTLGFPVLTIIAVLAAAAWGFRRRKTGEPGEAGPRQDVNRVRALRTAGRWALFGFGVQVLSFFAFTLLDLRYLWITGYSVSPSVGFGWILAGEGFLLTLALLLYLSWARSLSPIRRGEVRLALVSSRKIAVINLLTGFVLGGVLYLQADRALRRALCGEDSVSGSETRVQ